MKYYNFLEKAKNITKEYYNKLDAIYNGDFIQKCNALFVGQDISKTYLEEQKNAYFEEQRVSEITEKAKADLMNIKADYLAYMQENNALNGENIHSDYKLFESPIKLTQSEIQALSDKHYNNATMQRLIKDYADTKHILYIPAPSVETKIKSFNFAFAYMENAVNGYESDNSYYSNILNNGHIEKIIDNATCLNDTGNTESGV